MNLSLEIYNKKIVIHAVIVKGSDETETYTKPYLTRVIEFGQQLYKYKVFCEMANFNWLCDMWKKSSRNLGAFCCFFYSTSIAAKLEF